MSKFKLEIPSGKKCPADYDVKDAMIREAKEELLVNIDKILIGGKNIYVPNMHIFNSYWNNILRKNRIQFIKQYTREQTKASNFTIGCIIVNEHIPPPEINKVHGELFSQISHRIFGGDNLKENYIEYRNWPNEIKKYHTRNELWEYLEGVNVQYISLQDIVKHPNINFKTFWKKGIIYLSSIIY